SKPESYIVVSAHFDHVGISRGKIYNGADDNASGTAALFAIAKYFQEHPPEHSLIFAAFDAEEIGLEGAKHFVRNPPVSIEKILLNINLDMVSRSDKNELYISGTYHYPIFKTILSPIVEKVPVKLLFGHDEPEPKRDDWTFQSDHGVFHKKKIPFVYFGVEDHADYHRPTDDFEKVDKKFFSNSVKTIVVATDTLDKSLNSKK
ncbi:MAG: M28 family peptidase, partial [Pyrinomonadaceae bacterium]|nr:M28 family peptidase [Pyrinomonadaceae bacterium]